MSIIYEKCPLVKVFYPISKMKSIKKGKQCKKKGKSPSEGALRLGIFYIVRNLIMKLSNCQIVKPLN